MVIETKNLTKQYNGRGGCKDINLNIGEGTIFGFLGPNGAGKSTFVKTMTGLLKPTSGSAYILGKPLGDADTRGKIGFLPENFKYHDWMTGMECLKFHASLYKMKNPDKRINELIHLVKLSGHEHKKIKSYSKGMQQRLGLAISILPSSDLIFLDEPTSALDPIGRMEVREIIKELKGEGKTIFLNSHLLSEVEMVCDHVAIINKGHIIAQGLLKDLLQRSMKIEITLENMKDDILQELKNQYNADFQNGHLKIELSDKSEIPYIVKKLTDSGALIYELKQSADSLENLFIDLVEKDDTI